MKRNNITVATTAVVALLLLLTFGAPQASADTFPSDLTVANCSGGSNGCLSSSTTGPYGSVSVNRTSSTMATITFTVDAGYLFISAQAVDANISGTYTVSNLLGTPVAGAPKPSLSNGGSGTADGFGTFSTTINAFDGPQNGYTTISFDVTATGTTTWASAASVLTDNGSGYDAAGHIFVISSSTGLTGFAAEPSGTTSVPDGGMTLMLLGGALVGVETLRRKFRV